MQRIRVSIQISLKMSHGHGADRSSGCRSPGIFPMTDIRMVLMTPTMAIRIAMMAIESTMTLAVEMSFMMVSFTCARLTTWTSGS